MRRWLFVNELGGGLGHLVRLRHLARALVRTGDRLVLAVHDVDLARTLFRGMACDIHAAPPLPHLSDVPAPGYAGILEAFGFADPGRLLAVSKRWQRLFRDTRPEWLIADFAPFATFAARGVLPSFQIGSGFDLPASDGRRFLPFATGDAPTSEMRALASARRVARRLGAPVPATLPLAVSGDRSALVGLPWIDPFHGRRSEPAMGPLGPRPKVSPAPATGHIFAYLDPDAPGFAAIVRTLAQLPVQCSAYWRGGPPAVRHLLADGGVTVYDRPPDPARVLPTTTLVIGHGGAGLISDALFAGRAQLCLPGHREAALNAAALAATGAGRVLTDTHPDTLYRAIFNALGDIVFRDRALEMGEKAQEAFGVNPAWHLARMIRAGLQA